MSQHQTPADPETTIARLRGERDRALIANVRAAERIIELQLDVVSLQLRLDARETLLREIESTAGAA